MQQIFHGQPQWIWSRSTDRPFNRFVRFRRSLEVSGEASAATLRITADARYELWLNGELLGNGPARSWPTIWPVDEYDLTGRLQSGENVLAVRVHHFGISNFQYLHEEPGLLAELHWNDESGQHFIQSDSLWQCSDDERFSWPAPRISCQQGWEEQFDARIEADGWLFAGFDDANWEGAVAVRAAGEGAHPQFEKRDIPFLGQETVAPARLLKVEAVKPAPYSWSLMPRPLFNPDDLTANYLQGRMMVASYVYSEQAQKAEFHQPHHGSSWKLNGQELAFDDHSTQSTDSGVAHASLQAGWNLLLGKLPEATHLWQPTLNVWVEQPIEWSNRPETQSENTASPWLLFGPFELREADEQPMAVIYQPYVHAKAIDEAATLARWAQLWDAGTLTESDLAASYVRPFPNELVNRVDVFAICTSERVQDQTPVQVEERDALLFDNFDWTTIHPVEGADVRLLLDFGDELVGWQEWELDAPEGTVLDLHGFEFIQTDGRINLCEGMNNTVRYICSEGLQQYRTFGRRGFRYAWVSLRHFDRPVRLRSVRAVFNAYPQSNKGSFASSDAFLDRIWQVGAHSVRCCSEDTYTDCPTYEQTHWVGDARNEALVDLVVNGDPRLSRHCWLQTARSLDRSPIAECQVPSGWEVLLPAWTFLWMRWGWEHYRLSGDADFAREALPFLQRNFDGITQNLNAQGLFQLAAWNMFDWAPMDTPANGTITHLNCLVVLGLRETAQLARAIGEEDVATQWEMMADSISEAVNQLLWDEEKQAYIDCIRGDGSRSPVFSQQTQTAAYLTGVAKAPFGSDERAQRCREIIDNPPEGFIEAGSPFFMFFVLEALANENSNHELIETIRSYWGRQLVAGATTFWEMYFQPSYAQHNTSGMGGASLHRLTRSHCHGWSSAPTYFLTTHVLGLLPAKAGFASVVIQPHPGDLTWCRGTLPTPHGDIQVQWENDPQQPFSLRVQAPANIEVQVRLPREGKAFVNGREVA